MKLPSFGRRGGWLLPAASVVLLAYITLPVIVILGRTIPSGTLPAYLTNQAVVEALRLSLVTSLVTTGVTLVLGTPLAYLLARRDFPGKGLVDTLVDLPIVLPPAVAGIALLMTFGRRGLFGPLLAGLGLEVAFTSAAVVLAQLFVAAPYYVRSARVGFALVDETLEVTARTLGVGPWSVFRRVTVPLALPSLVGGLVLTWSKAVGEFGATILFAGSFAGRTRTMPLAIYQALESDLDAALVVAAILVIVSFLVLIVFRRASSSIGGPLGA